MSVLKVLLDLVMGQVKSLEMKVRSVNPPKSSPLKSNFCFLQGM